jgi:hypothetical protein
MEKPPLYQIVDWDRNFENHKSRDTGRCGFVCVPNRHGGFGLSAVLSEPDGRAIYGLWALMVQYCSRHQKPREGWLTHDGSRTGTRTTAAEIALAFRCQRIVEVYRMLQVTSRGDVDWLKLVEGKPEYSQNREEEGIPQGHLVSVQCPPADTAGTLSTQKEGRKEQKPENRTVPTATPLLSLSQNCEDKGLQYDEAKLWLNKLYNNSMPWTYEEEHLLSEQLPIPRDAQRHLDWAHNLPKDSPLHEMTKLKQKRVTLLRELGGEVEKLKMIRKQMGYGILGPKK